MRAVIFVNGIIPNHQAMRRWVREGDDLIAADGGAHHAIAMGLRPRVIVGDLDSVSPELAKELSSQGVELEKYPVAKDKTDLELALERAIRDGAQEIILLGALGGRLDQSLANVLLMANRDWPVTIKLIDAAESANGIVTEIATVIHGGETMTLEAAIGSVVSLLPLSAEVTGITYTGLLYPLNKATIALGSTRAVSNEVTSFPATVSIETGIALMIQALDGGDHQKTPLIEWTIQPARQSDIPLLQKTFPQGGIEKHPERFGRQQQGLVTYLIAWQGNEPVGHGLVKWQRPTNDPVAPLLQQPCPDLEDLFVVEELRSQGIGTQILRAAEEMAGKRGFHQLGLSADVEENDRARKLYKRLGYDDPGFAPFTERYEYVDQAGQAHVWEGLCIYLIKRID